MKSIEAIVIDGNHLELLQSISLKQGIRVMVYINTLIQDDENEKMGKASLNISDGSYDGIKPVYFIDG
ncbi:MAG: hypothetical protein HQK96_13445 [Nitrospirae bacterium]|nr:hypothetical protein [Nitrospirota bacterium]